jgi:hypothetical protein
MAGFMVFRQTRYFVKDSRGSLFGELELLCKMGNVANCVAGPGEALIISSGCQLPFKGSVGMAQFLIEAANELMGKT